MRLLCDCNELSLSHSGNATVKERANGVIIQLGTLVHTRVSADELIASGIGSIWVGWP